MSHFETSGIYPDHVAIIMDGNGRWAQARGLPRTAGHKVGADAVRSTVKAAKKLNIKYLTLFGFSSENWKRPKTEVSELMRLLRYYLRSETAELHKNNIRLRVIGNRDPLNKDIQDHIETAEELTKNNDGLVLTIAINYGGRHDIVQAAARMASFMKANNLPTDEQTAAEILPSFLMTGDIPDPDLLIRTSGEQRVSNFLLWQCAYSELIFSKTLWPDFKEQDLKDAIHEFACRDRRFGAMKSG